jgi:hypothetical protein
MDSKLVSKINDNLDNIFDKLSKEESEIDYKQVYLYYAIVKTWKNRNNCKDRNLVSKQLNNLYNRKRILKWRQRELYKKRDKILKVGNKFSKKIYGF